jgi:hypothetical protein
MQVIYFVAFFHSLVTAIQHLQHYVSKSASVLSSGEGVVRHIIIIITLAQQPYMGPGLL